jgi:hypothetical protein
MNKPLNQCTACGQDFASLAAFDEHVLSGPSDPDFDCLQVAQMDQAGWVQNIKGRWMSPKTAADAARVHRHYLREAA